MAKRAIGLGLLLVACLLWVGVGHATTTLQVSDAENAMTLLSQDNSGLTVRVDVGSLMFEEVVTQQGVYTLLSGAGLARSQRIGEPSLPTANRLISIPFGCELSAEVIASDFEEYSLTDLGLTYPLMPVQPSVSKSEDPMSIPFEINTAMYQQPGYYSLPLVNTEIKGVMRSVRLALVSVAPIEYDPVNARIRVYNKVTVRVAFNNPDWAETEANFRKGYSPYFEPALYRVMNYTEQASTYKDDLVEYPVKYLIVSDRMFEAQLQPFIEWKTEKGFEVITAYTDVIGTSSTAIKSYIQGLYNAGTPADPAPSFVLFVGDAQQIPPFSGSTGSHVTDLRFCEFTGDIFPEIYYGRFSAQNTTQLQPQIDKTLEYERYEMPDPSYLEFVTLVSGVDGTYAATHGNGQLNYGTTLYFNALHGITPHVWLYPASDQSGAAAAIIQSINDGAGLYNYTAHCSHSGHADPPFNTSDIPGLTNWHQYLLGIGNCCESNTFGTDYSTPCFGEAFLQISERGGIGYIGGSNSTYWYEDYYWGVGYGPVVAAGPTYEQTTLGAYDGLFHDHGEPVNFHYVTNDAIVFAGNMAVSESGSSREDYYWEIYHLMGDPSVMTYLGIPAVNNVTHDAAVVLATTSLTISADPGSYVGITFNGELQGSGYIGTSGTTTIDLAGFAAPGVANVVVTAQNREPYFGAIQVITPSGPYVIFDDASVNDASGNDNGLVDAGEAILMGVQLINVGPDDAYDVNATISTTDPYVTITDNAESYGTIIGDNGTAYVADGFAFTVSSTCPDKYQIAFDIEVTGTARDTWTGSFRVPVHAPEIGIVSVAIDDAGNDNGIIDPGETASITVTIENSGTGQAINTSGMLFVADPFVSISDNYGYYGLVDSVNGMAINSGDPFEVSVDAGCPMGYGVTVSLDISADNGFTKALSFDITVGDRVVFFFDDFSYDQGWTGLGGSAEWQMGPVGGIGGDPASDYSGTSDNAVLGNDLNGDGQYENYISPTQWVTSPVIDCSNMSGVLFKFYRWLGVERSQYDHVYLSVFDGTDWVQLYANPDNSFTDGNWTEENYDVGAYADHNPDFQIRFGMGTTDVSLTYCGWNIDDIELKGYGTAATPVCDIPDDELHVMLQPGSATTEYITVRNAGDGALRITFASAYTWLSCSGDQLVIAAGDSVEFPVQVNCGGMSQGVHTGSLTYTSNDGGHPTGVIPVTLTVACCVGLTGNVNNDAQDEVDLSDLIYFVNYLFSSGAPIPCPAEANVDGDLDGQTDLSDLIYLVNFLFNSGPLPQPCQ
ncbi:MAG: C25 family cysteine peptidase [candidate division Zixibacteria bacterium]|nr:C25 family cysteine peptidase [candidate division Zixibacteria bacterium]